MKININLLSLIALALVLTQINADTVNPYSGTGSDLNPICDAPGTLQMVPNDLATSSKFNIPTFDYVSTFFSLNGDSAPLLIKSGTDSVPFQFYTFYDDTMLDGKLVLCAGTSGATYITHFNEWLFLKSGSSYKVCKFVEAGVDSRTIIYTLTAPSAGGAITGITHFVPYYYSSDDSNLYVALSDGTNSAIYGYSVSSSSGGTTNPRLISQQLNKVITTIVGNTMIVYSPDISGDAVYAQSGPGITCWSSAGISVTANNIATVHGMKGGWSILAIVDSATKLTGKIYKFSQTPTKAQITYSDTTTAPFKDFSDGFSNFVRVGTTSMFWLHQKIDNTFIDSTYSIAELTRNNFGTVINEVALSGDKAVLFTDTTILYLKHISAGGIKSVLATSVSPLTLTGEYQYILLMSCMCKAMKRFACFSSTLNCIIVKKGRDNCSKADLFQSD